MSKIILSIVSALVLAMPLFAQENKTRTLVEDKQEVLRLEKELASSLLHEETKAVEALLADIYVLTVGDEVLDKPAVLEELRRLAAQKMR